MKQIFGWSWIILLVLLLVNSIWNGGKTEAEAVWWIPKEIFIPAFFISFIMDASLGAGGGYPYPM